MRSYKIAVMRGDGIGHEIIEEGLKVLDAAADRENFGLEWVEYPHGAEHYLKTGELLDEDVLKELERCAAIYFGCIGDPRLEPGILEQGILLAIRFYFDQYVNLRPVRLLEGVRTPLVGKRPEDIDFSVVRENTEDFYIGIGGRVKGKNRGKQRDSLEIVRNLYQIKFGLDIDIETDAGAAEFAYQIGLVTRAGCERVMRFAFDLARSSGKKKVTSVDKANVLTHSYGLWREVFNDVAKDYPEIEIEFNFVDATCMWFVKNPEWYKVVVAPNMFGDIITDLGAMIQGGLGLAPGGNINPDGVSMFEPIHGSAPKYEGKNVSNPIAAIWAGAMLLDNIGESSAAESVISAIETVLREGKVRTYDLGGRSKTDEVGNAIIEKIRI